MLTIVMIVAGLCAIPITRVIATTLATPSAYWLQGSPTLLDDSVEVSAKTLRVAQWVSSLIADASLIRGLQSVCFKPAASVHLPQEQGQTIDIAACLEEIEVALRSAPASCELWIFKASVLASAGKFGEPTINALRNAYYTGRNEGWIASRRVILGIKLFQGLPFELRDAVRSDIKLVLTDERLSQPIVDAYVRDALFRSAAKAVIDKLPTETIQSFEYRVRAAIARQRGP
jgi:hypothetical protein